MINQSFLTSDYFLKKNHETGVFSGYASVFAINDKHNDIVLPGAFADTDLTKVKILWQHEHQHPIGKILAIQEDSYGLWVEIKLLLDITKAKDVYAMLKENIIQHMSIGYIPIKYKTNAKKQRILEKVELLEISLVTFPANEMASVVAVKNNMPNSENLLNMLNKSINILREN